MNKASAFSVHVTCPFHAVPLKMNTAESSNERSWLQLRMVVRLLAIAFFVAVVIGIIISWVFYFRSYDKTFAALHAEELRLAQAIYNETNSRFLADMALMQMEAAQNASLILDIEMREAEQAFVNASLQADIEARITGDAAIAARLAEEIAERIGNDTLLTYQIGNATSTLEEIQAFDAYSDQQFVIIEGNITTISEAIEAEIAARLAAQAALMAADAIIQADLVMLISQLTAETAARIAQDNLINMKLHLITTSLLRTIDGQDPIAQNMVFQSLSASLVIANGVPSNQITLTQSALLTMAGVGGDPSGNLGITADNGLSVTFPGPNTVEIVYMGPVPPPLSNYARLTAVYPAVRLTDQVQRNYGQPLLNGYQVQCTNTPECQARPQLGSEWTCAGGFSTSPTTMRCVNNACSNENQCFNTLGQPWHCRGGSCVEDFCALDEECVDAHGPGWFCQNYGCTRAQSNSPFLPIYTDSYPNGNGVYQVITQPASVGSPPYTNAIFPQPGAYNGDMISFPTLSAYPFVYGNRRPYDPIMTYSIFNQQECIFDNSWEGQNCGFIMPASGTYVVQITVNIRAGINQPTSLCNGRMWFYMHIDRSGGVPPNWEMVDSDWLGINNVCSGCQLGEAYISMTTTLVLSTATPSSTFTSPIAPGTFVYAGWSAFNDDPHDCASGNDQFATWYSIVYDITQVA
jgi:hypothetical protein